MCKPKEEGELGLRDLKYFNFALLGKWKWRFVNEEPGLRRDNIISKYESWRALNETKEGAQDS